MISPRITSFLLGSGAALAAPRILPALSRVARPLAKSMIKGYLAIEGSAREVASRVDKQWRELVAEARAEREAAGKERERIGSGQPPQELQEFQD